MSENRTRHFYWTYPEQSFDGTTHSVHGPANHFHWEPPRPYFQFKWDPAYECYRVDPVTNLLIYGSGTQPTEFNQIPFSWGALA